MHTNTNTMNSTNSKGSSITAPKEKLMEDLRLVMSDAEDLLRATASQAGIAPISINTRITNRIVPSDIFLSRWFR